MKMRITVDMEVPTEIAEQIQRSGLSLVRSGTYMRVKVGGRLVGREQAAVKLEPKDDGYASRKEREISP